MIISVLGSSAAVTLYDSRMRMGGMNHFVHPQLKETDSPTALFARPATMQLMRMFWDFGVKSDYLQAHIFGGASPPDAGNELENIGKNNVDEAKRILSEYGVEIIGQEIGGYHGRKIAFNTETGEVIIAKVDKIRREDWFPGLDRD